MYSISDFPLNGKQTVAALLPSQQVGSTLYLFLRDANQAFLIFPAHMRPATSHSNAPQPVVDGIAIRMQEVAQEILEEGLRMLGTLAGLVLAKYQLLRRVPTSPIQPHIALALGFLPRFVEHLYGRFIRVQDVLLEQFCFHPLVHRLEPQSSGFQQPVGHGLPGERHPSPAIFLFLPVHGRAHDEFLGHDVGDGFRCGDAALDDRWVCGRHPDGGADVPLLAAPAGILVHMGLFHHELRQDDLQPLGHFLADVMHLPLALGTNAFFIRQSFVDDLDLDVLR